MLNLNQNRALVLFSGGQDSAICLAWALSRFSIVETVGFEYGQRHAVEMSARQALRLRFAEHLPQWRERLGEDHIIDLGFLSAIGETAMTHDMEIVMGDSGLPNTFVPGRNIAFINAAAALAYRREIGTLVGGMCQTDYSGYPDCRDEALQALLVALRLGMDAELSLHTPLMFLSKGESWAMAREFGGTDLVDLICEHSHTCYLGERGQRHEWGYGCGKCPACELRKAGWEDFQSKLP